MKRLILPHNVSVHWSVVKKQYMDQPSPDPAENELPYKKGYYRAVVVICVLCIILLLVMTAAIAKP